MFRNLIHSIKQSQVKSFTKYTFRGIGTIVHADGEPRLTARLFPPFLDPLKCPTQRNHILRPTVTRGAVKDVGWVIKIEDRATDQNHALPSLACSQQPDQLEALLSVHFPFYAPR